jgi:hypothetical protein
VGDPGSTVEVVVVSNGTVVVVVLVVVVVVGSAVVLVVVGGAVVLVVVVKSAGPPELPEGRRIGVVDPGFGFQPGGGFVCEGTAPAVGTTTGLAGC